MTLSRNEKNKNIGKIYGSLVVSGSVFRTEITIFLRYNYKQTKHIL